MYIDLLILADFLRSSLAVFVFVLFIWSIIWFVAFFNTYRRQQKNGPTVALIIKFGASSIFYASVAFSFIYLVSPYVTPLRSIVVLIWGNIAAIGIIIAYSILQWKFGGDDEN